MNKERTGGQILIDGLVKRGVDKVFCVPGESYLGALDALYDKQEQIQLITCRQEGGASYMADAYGKLTGNPGICFVSRGPGASNAMIGIHTAFQDSTPVLLFIGQISRTDTDREAFQELNYHNVYGDVAKKVLRFNSAHRIPEQLQKAWNIAIAGRPGPVVVELPEDMLVDTAIVDDLELITPSPSAPDPYRVEQLLDWITAAEKPMIISGGAGWTHQCNTLLEDFSQRSLIPVATSFRRSDTFDNQHPYYAGELGLAPNPELIAATRDSDLLIVIGPRLGDITTSSYQLLTQSSQSPINLDQKLVHIHISAEEINTVFHADSGITSHPDAMLQRLCDNPIEITESQKETRKSRIDKLNQSYLNFLTTPRFTDADVRMDKVAAMLRNHLPGDAIITNGAGNYTTWAQRHYQFRQFGTQLAPTNGSMGYGVPAAVAAKIVHPERMVVSFSGDGCFLMNGQELATAVQYGLNIIFLVINNNTYGTIQMHQQRHYPDRPLGTGLKIRTSPR